MVRSILSIRRARRMKIAAQDAVPERPFIAITLRWVGKRAGAEVIAINAPLLTTHTFPPVELDYDIIRPRRVLRGRIATRGA